MKVNTFNLIYVDQYLVKQLEEFNTSVESQDHQWNKLVTSENILQLVLAYRSICDENRKLKKYGRKLSKLVDQVEYDQRIEKENKKLKSVLNVEDISDAKDAIRFLQQCGIINTDNQLSDNYK